MEPEFDGDDLERLLHAPQWDEAHRALDEREGEDTPVGEELTPGASRAASFSELTTSLSLSNSK